MAIMRRDSQLNSLETVGMVKLLKTFSNIVKQKYFMMKTATLKN